MSRAARALARRRGRRRARGGRGARAGGAAGRALADDPHEAFPRPLHAASSRRRRAAPRRRPRSRTRSSRRSCIRRAARWTSSSPTTWTSRTGYTTVFPTNRITIYALPPLDEPSLAFYDCLVRGDRDARADAHLPPGPHRRVVEGGAGRVRPRAAALPERVRAGVDHRGARRLLRERAHRRRPGEGDGLGDGRPLHGAAAPLPRLGQLEPRDDALPVRRHPAYDYGAEFLDWLATTHGSATLGRNSWSARAAGRSRSPTTARRRGRSASPSPPRGSAWRDSLERATRGRSRRRRAPLPGWRDLTREGFYALRPRWSDDGSARTTSATSARASPRRTRSTARPARARARGGGTAATRSCRSTDGSRALRAARVRRSVSRALGPLPAARRGR